MRQKILITLRFEQINSIVLKALIMYLYKNNPLPIERTPVDPSLEQGTRFGANSDMKINTCLKLRPINLSTLNLKI